MQGSCSIPSAAPSGGIFEQCLAPFPLPLPCRARARASLTRKDRQLSLQAVVIVLLGLAFVFTAIASASSCSRIATLEAEVAAQRDRMATPAARSVPFLPDVMRALASLASRVTSLSARVAFAIPALKRAVVSLGQGFSSLTHRMTSAEGKGAAMEARMASVETAVSRMNPMAVAQQPSMAGTPRLHHDVADMRHVMELLEKDLEETKLKLGATLEKVESLKATERQKRTEETKSRAQRQTDKMVMKRKAREAAARAAAVIATFSDSQAAARAAALYAL